MADNDEEGLNCPICNDVMFSLARLNVHLADEHTDAEKRRVYGDRGANLVVRVKGSSSTSKRPSKDGASTTDTSSSSSSSGGRRADDGGDGATLAPQPFGFSRSLFYDFKAMRERTAGRMDLETNRLLTRLEKLTNSTDGGGGGSGSGGGGGGAPGSPSSAARSKLWFGEGRKAFERDVVPWQDDATAFHCKECEVRFSAFKRKHHCRLCGQVMCGGETCYRMLPTDRALYICEVGRVNAVRGAHDRRRAGSSAAGGGPAAEGGRGGKGRSVSTLSEKSAKERAAQRLARLAESLTERELRVCATCHHLLERRVKQAKELAAGPSPLHKHYATMVEAKEEIERLLPRFRELFQYLCLREGESQRLEAMRIRERLIKLFETYDRISKYIAAIPIPSHLFDPKEGDPQYELELAQGEKRMAARQKARATRRGQHMRLRSGIRQACTAYLQDNMLTLQMLPPKGKQASVQRQIQQEQEEQLRRQQQQQHQHQHQQQHQQQQQHRQHEAANGTTDSGGGGSSSSSSGSRGGAKPRADLPARERQKMVDVLLEQKMIVDGFIRQAMDEGRTDDLVSLRRSLWDLEQELLSHGVRL